MAPGTTAIVQSAEISGTESKQLLMKFYEAVDDFVLQVCKNDLNTCENISNPQISVDDRSWKEAIVKIPPDTKKVLSW